MAEITYILYTDVTDSPMSMTTRLGLYALTAGFRLRLTAVDRLTTGLRGALVARLRDGVSGGAPAAVMRSKYMVVVHLTRAARGGQGGWFARQ